MKIFRLIIVAVVFMLLGLNAERLDLKDGRSFEGEVFRSGETVKVVTTKGKVYQFPMSNVAKIGKGSLKDTEEKKVVENNQPSLSHERSLIAAERRVLAAERAALEAEKRAFEAEKRAFKVESMAGSKQIVRQDEKISTVEKSVKAEVVNASKSVVDDAKNPLIRFETSFGVMEFELFEDKAPNTVANFIELTEKGFYKGVSFHRIINGFMAQTGCPNSKIGTRGALGGGGPGYRFADETSSGLKHSGRGILSMANAGPGTNGSQFFICFRSLPSLDGKHTVFGRVVKGIEVLDDIEECGTRSGNPIETIRVLNVRVLRKRSTEYRVKKL
ncbi:MAG: peptidylprolyl isomerase [Lentisphaeria bacterium]